MLNAAKPTFDTRKIDDRSLIVADDIFEFDFIVLFDHFLRGLRFSLADYDAEDNRHVLHWIHEFSTKDVISHPLLSIVYSKIKSAAESVQLERQIDLKRVHCNTSLYGDIQFPHADLTPGFTWLYYANAKWERDWMGETIFYDGRGEPICAVLPKPGRVLLFDADILHRGGVPSRDCTQARRSLAFKFLSRTDR